MFVDDTSIKACKMQHAIKFYLVFGSVIGIDFAVSGVGYETYVMNNIFPKRQILDSSILKEYADDNFEFDENGILFFKCVENTVGKGEIAHHEQFLLFPQCFQKTCTADT